MQAYLDSLSKSRTSEDLRLISEFSKQIKVENENLFVLIPCYIEETGLRESLLAYVESGVPLDCLFVVFVNAGEQIDQQTFHALVTKRLFEIENARSSFPPNKVVAICHHFESKPTLSRIRGLVTDAVVMSILEGESNNPVIVSNDADAIWYSPNYLKYIRSAFDENPHVDYMSGPISWSGTDEDGFVRYQPEVPLPEIYLNDLFSQIADEIYREHSPVYTTGCNSAYRLETLCTIGGYNYDFAPFFDVEIGNVLNSYRKSKNQDPKQHGKFLNECFLITNPRRAIYAHLKDIPYGQQFETFGEVFGSNIDLKMSIELYRSSPLFLQWEELLAQDLYEEKIQSRLCSTLLQWLDGEPTPLKSTLVELIAPSVGLAIKELRSRGTSIEKLEIDWQNSSLASILGSWASLYSDEQSS